MQAAFTYTPQSGVSEQVNLLLQSGYIEVINDSSFLLIITLNTGTCYLVPGTANLYPCPPGGAAFTIQAQPVFNYLFTDLGVSNNVTVNQYLEGEIAGKSWPFSLVRSVSQAINVISQFAEQASGVLSSALTLTLSGANFTASDVDGNLFLAGFHVTVDQESTVHGYTLSISDLTSQQTTFTYNFHSVSNSTSSLGFIQISDYFDPPISSSVSGKDAAIVLSIAAVSGATARGSINAWGFFQ